MQKEPRCDSCAYALGNGVAPVICCRYPKTVPKTPEMWCGEWRDKDVGAVVDLRAGMYVVPDASVTTYNYTTDTIGGHPPAGLKKKRGRPRKSGI